MIRFLAARVRRAYSDGEHCAVAVVIWYIEPFGLPRWAVWAHHQNGDSDTLGRSRWLWLALWRAWRAAS